MVIDPLAPVKMLGKAAKDANSTISRAYKGLGSSVTGALRKPKSGARPVSAGVGIGAKAPEPRPIKGSGKTPAQSGRTTALAGTPTSAPAPSTSSPLSATGMPGVALSSDDVARSYLESENARSQAMGSKNYVSSLRDQNVTTLQSRPGTGSQQRTLESRPEASAVMSSLRAPSAIDTLRQRVGSLAVPGSEEARLEDELAQFRGDARMGISGLEGQGRGIPLSLIRGQQSQLAEQAGIKEQTLMDRIAAASAQRQAALQAAQTELGYAMSDQERQDKLAATAQARMDSLTAPTQVGNSILQLDPITGQYKTLYTAPAGVDTDRYASASGVIYDKATGEVVSYLPSGGGEGYTLSPGQVRYDASGNVIASAPAAPGASNATEGERSSAGFYNRALAAEQTLQSLGGNVGGKFLQSILPNGLRSAEYQQFKQAGEDFIKAVLRAESGASIPPDEMDSYFKTYFPQPGDSEAVIAQKSAARQRQIQALQIEAGRALSGLESAGQAVSSTSPDTSAYAPDSQTAKLLTGRKDATGQVLSPQRVDELARDVAYLRSIGQTNQQITNLLNEELGFTSASRALSGNQVTGKQAGQVLSTYSSGSYGGQCGRFVNRLTGLQMGNTFASKMKYVDRSIGTGKNPVQPGDFFVMPYKSYGHTGFVADGEWIKKPDGSYDIPVVDSNWYNTSRPEKVAHHYINSKQISGFGRAPVSTRQVSFA